MEAIEDECLDDHTSDKGAVYVGCGYYNIAITPTATTMPVTTIFATTPPGSSCASTSFIEDCTPGGSQSLCVVTQTCESWVNTVPASTTQEPPAKTSAAIAITPLELKPVVCDSESNYPGHADIRGDAQADLADRWCTVEPMDNDVLSIGPGEKGLESYREDRQGTKYWFSVSWIDGCVTTVDRQKIYEPFGSGGILCQQIFKNDLITVVAMYHSKTYSAFYL
ncbi:hypothetical protein BKA56DRAFT_706609 [Ilyonectria sp. MPI-CAGE-AT-0026]|nr:hypothetical protein BKA56DRAFT_706609 [Ilyonectria sp. MPI-CAGE-AT-0026]